MGIDQAPRPGGRADLSTAAPRADIEGSSRERHRSRLPARSQARRGMTRNSRPRDRSRRPRVDGFEASTTGASRPASADVCAILVESHRFGGVTVDLATSPPKLAPCPPPVRRRDYGSAQAPGAHVPPPGGEECLQECRSLPCEIFYSFSAIRASPRTTHPSALRLRRRNAFPAQRARTPPRSRVPDRHWRWPRRTPPRLAIRRARRGTTTIEIEK